LGVFDAVGRGDGVGVGLGVLDAVGRGDGVGVGLGVFDAVGRGDGVGVGLGVFDAVGRGDGVGVGLGVFDAVGRGDAVGVSLGVFDGVGRGFGDSDLGDKGVGLGEGAPGVGRRNLSSFTGVGLGDIAFVGFVINVVFSSGVTFSSTGGITGED